MAAVVAAGTAGSISTAGAILAYRFSKKIGFQSDPIFYYCEQRILGHFGWLKMSTFPLVMYTLSPLPNTSLIPFTTNTSIHTFSDFQCGLTVLYFPFFLIFKKN